MEKYRVGVIGGTGMVGQRLCHPAGEPPLVELTAIAASARSAGKTYEEAIGARWALDVPMPEAAKGMVVYNAETDIEEIAARVDFVFSAVDMKKEEIQALEEAYAKHECPVVSNNSAHRWTPDVPMVVPEINPEHIRVIEAQRKRLGRAAGASSPSSPTAPSRAMSPPCIPCGSSGWSRCWCAPIRPSPAPVRPLQPGRTWWTT